MWLQVKKIFFFVSGFIFLCVFYALIFFMFQLRYKQKQIKLFINIYIHTHLTFIYESAKHFFTNLCYVSLLSIWEKKKMLIRSFKMVASKLCSPVDTHNGYCGLFTIYFELEKWRAICASMGGVGNVLS